MILYLCGTIIFAGIALYMRKQERGKSSRQKAAFAAAAGCLLAFLLAAVDGKNASSDYIKRADPGEGSQEKLYVLEAGEVFKDYPWSITAEERQYTAKEKKKVIKRAQKELEKLILAENKSLEEINSDLYLPQTLQKEAVEVTYSFSDYEIFYPDGTIRKLPKKDVVVTISAEMECQGETFLYEFGIRTVPEKKGEKELLTDKIETMINKENKRTGKDRLILPKKVDGISLSWEEKKENRSLPAAVLGLAAAGCILAMEKEKEKKSWEGRERMLRMDYPEILGKFILLMGAGMNAAAAWKQIAGSYRKRRGEGRISIKPAYEEMLITVYEMQEGISEVQAYENFGERCGIAEYRKLSAILVQNVRKGNAQIQRILEEEKTEAYEKQRARVKIAGEEAGTKLLFPMLLMLLVVLLIIMVPAGMSMQM